MYPLWPNHAAWNPSDPNVSLVGAGIPGPTDDAQVAALATGDATSSAAAITDAPAIVEIRPLCTLISETS